MGLSVPVAIASDQAWPTLTTDVSDRAGRLLGIIASITAAIDVSDRDTRRLGRTSLVPQEFSSTRLKEFNQAFAGNAVLALTPVVGGQFTYALGLTYSVDTVGNTDIILEETDGAATVAGIAHINTTSLGKNRYQLFGWRTQLAVGTSYFQLRNISAVASGNISGSFAYVMLAT
jgi:hypothetical protein